MTIIKLIEFFFQFVLYDGYVNGRGWVSHFITDHGGYEMNTFREIINSIGACIQVSSRILSLGHMAAIKEGRVRKPNFKRLIFQINGSTLVKKLAASVRELSCFHLSKKTQTQKVRIYRKK